MAKTSVPAPIMSVKHSNRPCSQDRLRLSLVVLATLILECLATDDLLAESAEYSNSVLIDETFEEDGFIRYFLM